MERQKTHWLISLLKSFYFMTGAIFVIWMLFFDSNSLIHQIDLKNKLEDLQNQATYYTEGKQQIEEDMEALQSSPEALEKFAREKYLFKRKGEDIFVVEE